MLDPNNYITYLLFLDLSIHNISSKEMHLKIEKRKVKNSREMGDSLRAGRPSPCVISHPGQLSLAIPPWVVAVSTGDGNGRHQERKLCSSRPWDEACWYTDPGGQRHGLFN